MIKKTTLWVIPTLIFFMLLAIYLICVEKNISNYFNLPKNVKIYDIALLYEYEKDDLLGPPPRFSEPSVPRVKCQYEHLQRIGALDKNFKITQTGKEIIKTIHHKNGYKKISELRYLSYLTIKRNSWTRTVYFELPDSSFLYGISYLKRQGLITTGDSKDGFVTLTPKGWVITAVLSCGA